MVSKWIAIANIVAIAITIASIAGSAYGVGKEEADKSSPGYIAASQGLTISIILCIVFIISLVLLTMYDTGSVQFKSSAFSSKPPSYSGGQFATFTS